MTRLKRIFLIKIFYVLICILIILLFSDHKLLLAAKKNTVKFGVPLKYYTFLDLPVIVGRHKGFFESEGLDVKIVNFDNPRQAFIGLIAGHADVTHINSAIFLQFYQGEKRIKIISSSVPGMPYSLVGDQKIKTAEDLKKAKVLVRSKFDSFVIAAMMQNYELSLADVKVISAEVPLPEVLYTLDRKVFDAGLVPAYAGYELIRFKNLHRIVEVVKELPLFVYSYEISSSDFIRKHPDKLRKFTSGLVKSTRFLTKPEHIDELVQISMKLKLFPFVKPNYLKDSIKAVIDAGAYSVNGGVYYDEFSEFTITKLFEFKMVKERIKLSEVWNKRFIIETIKSFGPVDGPKGPRPCSVHAP